MNKINVSKENQTKDGYPVRYLGMTSNDGHLIWEASKPYQGDTVFKTNLYGVKVGGGISEYWDVIPVKPKPVTKWLWLSTAQFMDPAAKPATTTDDRCVWSEYKPHSAIIRPGSIWYECEIDVETGDILSMTLLK